MKAVLAEVPPGLIEDRRRSGLDRYDEMWEGVLYLAAAPRRRHQRVVAALIAALHEPAVTAGLVVEDGINVCNPDRPFDDYRIPDLVVVEPDAPTIGDDFGVTGGVALAVDVRSPREDAEAKLAFYAQRGVAHVLVVDIADPQASSVRLFRLRGGSYEEAAVGVDGETSVLGVEVSPIGPDATGVAHSVGVVVRGPTGQRYV